MSRYGSKTNSQGEEIKENGSTPILTGEKVKGNVIEYFGFSKDQNGETIENRAEVCFKQTNGAKFTYSFFDSELDWAIDKLNRELLHICTKFVTKEEFYSVVEGATSFQDLITRIVTSIVPKATGKSFTLKIVYRQNKTSGKWFVGFPNFPNFIELDGETPSTLKTDPKYDYYEPVKASTVEETADAKGDSSDLF